MKILKTRELGQIVEKVEAGQRVTYDEGLKLMNSHDLITLGYLGNLVRRRVSGESVYYTVNYNLNPTNICVITCALCSYKREEGDQDAYVVSVKQAREKIQTLAPLGLREVHVVGGLYHKLPFSYFEELCQMVKAINPAIHVHGFTAVEIDFFARVYKMPLDEVLTRLKQAGLDSMPGGGAEIFAKRVRDVICKPKISGERWLAVHEAAHRLGIRSNATMLYGHIETPEERVDHLLVLRDLQDRSHGFWTFVPLSYHVENNPLGDLVKKGPSGLDDLRVVAASRVILDNFPHLKVLWMYLGIKLAQTALEFGGDDLSGTSIEEKIIHEAGATTPDHLDRGTIVQVIREIGRTPVETHSGYETSGESGKGGESEKKEKLKLGYLKYVNCLPFYYGLQRGVVRTPVELLQGSPVQLNQWLASKELDVSPISSVEYARHQDEYVLLPDFCLNSVGEVKSVLLVSRVPVQELKGKSVMLTNTSATSQVLLKTILAKKYGIRPSYRAWGPNLGEMLKQGDAALLIGDEALMAPIENGLYYYDLAKEWQDFTGQPVVFVVWAVRKEIVKSRKAELVAFVAAMKQSLAYGLAHLDEVATLATASTGKLQYDFAAYYRCLGYSFSPPLRQALLTYYDQAADAGFIPACKTLKFMDGL